MLFKTIHISDHNCCLNREAGDDQFADFCEEVTAEVEQGSEVAKEVKNILDQIEQSAARAKEDKPRVCCNFTWSCLPYT